MTEPRVLAEDIDQAIECLAFAHLWERSTPNLVAGTGRSSGTIFQLFHYCTRCGSEKTTRHDFYGRSIGSGVISPSLHMAKAKELVNAQRTDVDFTVNQQYRRAYFQRQTRTETKVRRLKAV